MRVKDMLFMPLQFPNHTVYFLHTKEGFRVTKDKEHLFYECNVLYLGCGGRGCKGYIAIYCDGTYEEMVGEDK